MRRVVFLLFLAIGPCFGTSSCPAPSSCQDGNCNYVVNIPSSNCGNVQSLVNTTNQEVLSLSAQVNNLTQELNELKSILVNFVNAATPCIKLCNGTDPCNGYQCYNNGTCYAESYGPHCECPQPFSGTHCELGPTTLQPTTQDPCNGYMCFNNGTCYAESYGPHCECPQPFSGAHCELGPTTSQPTTQDPCNGYVCFNNGTCYAESFGPHCECPQPFSGAHCELGGSTTLPPTTENPCHNFTCHNGGICFLDLTGPHCSCPHPYIGPHCEFISTTIAPVTTPEITSSSSQTTPAPTSPTTSANPCLSYPCQNGGTCYSESYGPHCECRPGFSGDHCEIVTTTTPVPLTTPDPCSVFNCSHGTCILTPSGPLCNCDVLWTGPHCSVPICAPGGYNPCIHGNCTRNSGTAGYNCTCHVGWTGPNCNNDVNECLRKPPPCGCNSTCHNTLGSYRCDCAPGYTGPDCCTDIDECLNHPCHDNGTCVNTIGSYHCICPGDDTGANCQNHIVCKPGDCGVNADCFVGDHGKHCVCKPGYAGNPYIACSLHQKICCESGDPHYQTFDRAHFSYQGTCPYVETEPCNATALQTVPYFQVLAKNLLPRFSSRVSYVFSTEVRVYGLVINATIDTSVHRRPAMATVNKARVYLPWYYPDAHSPLITLTAYGKGVSIETDFHLKVILWNSYRLCVYMPDVAELQSNLCGFCGNMDGDSRNDLRLKNGTVTGSSSVDVNAFGDSWVTNSNANCTLGADNNPSDCPSPEAHMIARERCAMMQNLTGPFEACQNFTDLLPQLFEDCVYDQCAYWYKDWQDALCDSYSNLATKCQADVPGAVIPWRNADFCPLTCPIHQHYEACASACPSSCSNRTSSQTCNQPCYEGCACDYGYILDGAGNCILPLNCGCTDLNGNIFPANSTWVNDNCTQVLTCTGGVIVASNMSCANHARCEVENSVRDCYCDAGFSGNGRSNCTDINECLNNNTCVHSSNCTNYPGTFECTCEAGWIGKHCDHDINECLNTDRPHCLCNSTCVNTQGSFYCNCTPGFTGPTCCTDIDECLMHPCQHNGTCNNTIGSYKCSCPGDTSGTNCEHKIVCGQHDCGANAVCFVGDHAKHCVCKPGYSGDPYRGCNFRQATCCASGDPHYTTFDSLHYSYQGTCPYVFSQTCANASLSSIPPFKIEAKDWLRIPTARVSYIFSVQLTVYGNVINATIDPKNRRRVTTTASGPKVYLPWYYPDRSNPRITVNAYGSGVVIETDFKLKIILRNNYRLCVYMPKVTELEGGLCGFCGNMDGNRLNDLMLKNGTITGNTKYDVNAFGDSWVTDDTVNDCVLGVDTNPSDCPNPAAHAEARSRCAELNNPSGPFAACQNFTDLLPNLLDDCVYDQCANWNGNWTGALCNSYSNFATKCQSDLPGTVINWRTHGFCPMDCPVNQHYEPCATACPSSCANQTSAQSCSEPCFEGCTCNAGYVLNGDGVCIHPAQCGCTDPNGNSYPANLTWVNANCSLSYTCSSGVIVTRNISCAAHAACGVENQEQDCYCLPGFSGNGRSNCTDINECLDNTTCVHGNCTNTIGSYTCTCGPNYIGPHCNQHVDYCANVTCSNGGTCLDNGYGYTCQCANGYWGPHCRRTPQRHCADLMTFHDVYLSDIYTVRLPNGDTMTVYCDMMTEGGGWTLISSRRTGVQDFYQKWTTYRDGFGDLKGEFWLGNKYLNILTNDEQSMTLRVDLWYCPGNGASPQFEEYDLFSVGSENASFPLTVGTWRGTAGNSLAYPDPHLNQNGVPFSTFDRDNDKFPSNCAQLYHGGFWYNACAAANLNGQYYPCGMSGRLDAIFWLRHSNDNTPANRVEMKFRPTGWSPPQRPHSIDQTPTDLN